MEKIEKYTQAVLDLLQTMHHEQGIEQEEIHEEIIVDAKKQHYFLLCLGFKTNHGFEDSVIVHFHIKPNGKIWVLANWTEEDVAQALVERGVEKSDIVLGFHPKAFRQHTGYAVA